MCFKNRNICGAFLFVASNGITYSIWGSPLLPLFIQVFTGDSTNSTSYVGIAEGAQGAVQCLFALISGVLADKMSRHVVLKSAGVAQLLAALATLLAVYYKQIFPTASSSAQSSGFYAANSYDAAAYTEHYAPLHYVGLGQLGPSDGTNFTCNPTNTSVNATTAAPVTPFEPQDNVQWYLLCAACGMWGAYSGLYGPSMEALFADSIMTGERAKYYTIRQVVQTVARATGPLLALIAFYFLNDQWTLPTLTYVLTGGLVLTVFPSVILITVFHDKFTLGLKNEAITATRKDIEKRQKQSKERGDHKATTDPSESAAEEEDGEHVDKGAAESSKDDITVARSAEERQQSGASSKTQPQELVDPLAGAEGDDDADDEKSSEEPCCCECCAGVRAIPWIILASNTVTGFATGMTVKFFPLFFKNAVCLTPANVNIIYAVTPFLQVRVILWPVEGN